jgi:hypothetical protein
MTRMLENEAMISHKVAKVLKNLGWELEYEKAVEGYKYRFDLILKYNEKYYGVVEIFRTEDIDEKTGMLLSIIDTFVEKSKPPIFIITNGYKYDIYHFGKFYGSLMVPPTPENINTLLGGEI